MIKRKILKPVLEDIKDNRAIIIYGARRTGKTTFLKQIEDHLEEKPLKINGDETPNLTLFENITVEKLRFIFGNHKYIFIDEAQKIKNIDLAIKLCTDNLPSKIIATGSSSFDLANKLKEPLTGRVWEYKMFAFSFEELVQHFGALTEMNNLENRLIYGSYPEVILNPEKAKRILLNLADQTLFKDIFALGRIKKPDTLVKLTAALAYQIGNEVSMRELASITGTDKETVERYITILERAFVIFRLNSFSRNLRDELKKSVKIYFWDNGIRNAVINNFNHLNIRNDIGQLWENYIISERIKFLINNNINAKWYFWRTYGQQEIDFIEEQDGQIYAYEIKWNPKKRSKKPVRFIESYNAKFVHISPVNYFEFLSQTIPKTFA